ncbi:PAS domain S-box-containing protein [Rubricella aquisinus]|uniref:PAS domain S-box-containing protein n=1 Tax=Rubricella aquisinus TaxID=2028108 RepID=A0A840WN02_9RHOB|nr:PAS domain-containing protein [Rubricella aquisinus]MBB5516448.1 PAS domain S-box-containing protein [Rubricella aquisinus]
MDTPKIPAPVLDFMHNSQVALSVSCPRLPDNPIIAVNDSFSRLTGYSASEVEGRNCRFLQGDTEQPKMRAHLRDQMAHGHDAQVILRNFRKSGEPFDNYLFIFPILGGDGDPSFFVGSQFEIPQVERAVALRSHAERLHESLDQMNAAHSESRDALIRCGHLLGLEARALIKARIAALP